jgi:hypothetical protein
MAAAATVPVGQLASDERLSHRQCKPLPLWEGLAVQPCLYQRPLAQGDGSDTINALAALAASIQKKPTPDPLAVARGLAETADLGA